MSFPLSANQQALWLAYQSNPAGDAYNILTVSRINQRLDLDALHRAFGMMIARHPALRTRFTVELDHPVQVVLEDAELDFQMADVPSRDPETLKPLWLDEGRRPFDLSRAPLMRVRIYSASPDEHYLLVVFHHIIVDAHSIGILLEDLTRLYRLACGRAPDELASPDATYEAYVRAESVLLAGPDGDRLRDFWRGELSGDAPVSGLPEDRVGQTASGGMQGEVAFRIEDDLTEKLRAVAREGGSSLYATLLAALQVLLARYSGNTDLIIGCPAAGRTDRKYRDVVGFFVNSLPLRADLSDNPPFGELLQRARSGIQAALRHQDYPYSYMTTVGTAPRTGGQTPFFEVLFNFLRMRRYGIQQKNGTREAGAPRLPDSTSRVAPEVGNHGELVLEPLILQQAGGDFPVEIMMLEFDRTLSGSVHFDTGRYDTGTIEQFLQRYRLLLESIASNPEERVKSLRIETPEEQFRSTVEWNRTESEFPRDLCLHQLFEQQAARTPRNAAIRFRDVSLTYSDLDTRAARVAHLLKESAIGHGARVGLLLDRTPMMVAAMLGVLKAGGTYVPFDPDQPASRIGYLLSDAECAVVLAEDATAASLPPGTRSIILSPALFTQVTDHSRLTPLNRAGQATKNSPKPSDLAYIIYTSGSTGQPKGVAVTHRNLVHSTTARFRFYPDPPSAYLLVWPFSSDSSVAGIFWTLCSGGSLVIAPTDTPRDPEQIAETIAQFRISHLDILPVLYEQVMRSARQGQLESLRVVILGGEAVHNTAVALHRSALAGVRLFNEYGPTECTVWATAYEVTGDMEGRRVPIGKPIANCKVYILDEDSQPVPVGVPGEIVIGGEGVAHGYWKLPELTSERFVADPFAGRVGARMYRTGDRGRLLADGMIEYLGRRDGQTKVRGYRIETGEVEAALRGCAGVRDAVVVTREDPSGQVRLVAYLLGEEGTLLKHASIRACLATKLPAYMIPSTVVPMESLPLTSGGKVDRHALPAPAEQEAARGNLTPVQEILAGIWREILGKAEINPDDSFFDLGGHSLLVAQVVARIRETFHIELPMREVFEVRTLRALAERIESGLKAANPSPTLPPIMPVERGRDLPLSYAQQRMWLLHRMDPLSAAYNMSALITLSGDLDEAALVRAWDELVRRHESFRTTFPVVDGVPMQRISADGRCVLRAVDLRTGSTEAVQRCVEEEARMPFDLGSGPVVRPVLVRTGDDEWLLSVTAHHIVGDAWSFGVVGDELATLYGAYSRGEQSPLPVPKLHYADYAVWQLQWLSEELLESKLGWWRKHLSDLAVLNLPTDFTRPAVRTSHGSLALLDIPPEVFGNLELLGRGHGATLFMTLLAAFKVLLQKITGQTDIGVGIPVSNRSHVDTESMMGILLNTLVMRTEVTDDMTFSELLVRVRDEALDVYTHQDVPFEKLVEELQSNRDPSRPPLVQAFFNLPNGPAKKLVFPGLEWKPVPLDRRASQFELSLTIDPELPGLAGLEYNTDLFTHESMERLLRQYRLILDSCVANPYAPLWKLSLLEEADRRRILGEWNATALAYPETKCVHQLIEAEAAKRPGTVAIVFNGAETTYAELNARANQLARVLRRRGIGRESRVAVYLDRSTDLIVTLLAIQKTGATYVPIALSQPQQRVAYYLEDSGAQLIVTTSALDPSLPSNGTPRIQLDSEQSGIAAEPVENLDPAADSRALAYIMYTSGSTGLPKGVAIEHRSVVNFLWSMQRDPGLAADDVLLSVTAPSFDISGLEYYLPLITGARVVIAGESVAQDGRLLAALMRNSSATVMQATPSTWQILLNSGWAGKSDLKILCGGEPMSQELAKALLERAASVWNVYGPTETTIWSSAWNVAPELAPISIGRPIANTTFFILDKNRQPVPEMVTGELYIGGDGLARGYWNRPELTAERFVTVPFDGTPGVRLYRTGDRARYLPDGRVECLGRLDDQIKIRGHRIEPGEIESALKKHDGVGSALVMALPQETGESALAAYVVPAPDHELTPKQIREFLQRSLPAHLVPSAIVILAEFPLTPNGKVDRKRLPVPDVVQHSPADEYVAPRDALEIQLTGIWESVLGRKPIGIRDNFFELGGHSLVSVKLFTLVEKLTGKNLPLVTLFQAPTVEKFAAILRQEGWTPPWSSLVAMQPGGSRPPFYIAHGVGGNVLDYIGLARFFGKDQPLYGLQAQGLDGKSPRHETVKEMAEHYIREIRELQPHGPYYIGGGCLGGYTAFEMARQLVAQGEKVGMLALIDIYAPGHPRPDRRVAVARRLIGYGAFRVKTMVESFVTLRGRERWSYAALWWGNYRFAVRTRLERFARASRDRVARRSLPQALRNVQESGRNAFASFVPGAYKGRLDLFSASKRPFGNVPDPTMGWSEHANGELAIHVIPGHERALTFEPAVRSLATELLACLDERMKAEQADGNGQ